MRKEESPDSLHRKGTPAKGNPCHGARHALPNGSAWRWRPTMELCRTRLPLSPRLHVYMRLGRIPPNQPMERLQDSVPCEESGQPFMERWLSQKYCPDNACRGARRRRRRASTIPTWKWHSSPSSDVRAPEVQCTCFSAATSGRYCMLIRVVEPLTRFSLAPSDPPELSAASLYWPDAMTGRSRLSVTLYSR